jgi:poly-gamma-glutamate capsule biosynthesis protein CapA/YwtB (metallophosphatase superfamily)
MCLAWVADYEGISGHEQYRGELVLAYFPVVDAQNGKLLSLAMLPLHLCQFQLHHAGAADAMRLAATLSRIGMPYGTSVEYNGGNWLRLRW